MPETRPKPPVALVRRARRVNRVLAATYPDAHCELDFSTPFQLLVATVLSAQSTDVGVNAVTPELFARYPDADALSVADLADVERIIRPTGFYRNKASAIVRLSQALVADHGGEVPRRLAELVQLPGVGRKTANVVLGNAYGIPGITVDTHVKRLSRRLGWTDRSDPDRIEEDLAALFSKRDWTQMCHNVIWHGRRRCHARRPACGACPVAAWCPSYGEGPTDPEVAARLVKDGPR